MHLCIGFTWLTTDVHCHRQVCLHGRERPFQLSLWLSTSSRSPHNLQSHHWGWEGESRGQTHRLQEATTGLEYLCDGHFHCRCFRNSLGICSVQGTETFPHNLSDWPQWVQPFHIWGIHWELCLWQSTELKIMWKIIFPWISCEKIEFKVKINHSLRLFTHL